MDAMHVMEEEEEEAQEQAGKGRKQSSMEDVASDSCDGNRTSILDLDVDSFVHCVSHLDLRDLANLGFTCRRMRDAISVAPIWEHQCRKRWPAKQASWGTFQYCGDRDAYRERHVASWKFQFLDPTEWHFETSQARASHILIEDDHIIVSQGPTVIVYDVVSQSGMYMLSGHNAQITCMRLVPSTGLIASRGKSEKKDYLLVTSSMDHTIRLWHNGQAVRTLRGHNGPVTTLSSGILGSQLETPTLASGGIDGTIRLWALVSGQKRGQTPLQKTLHAHELAIKQLVVPEYNPSLLVSAAKDLKVRVWNVTTGGLVRSIKASGVPIGLACKGSTCYVACGCNIMLTDLHSTSVAASVIAHESGIRSFATSSTGEIICTGGADEVAKLWDVRNLGEPYAILGKQVGDVDFVYVDNYKAVTGGFKDSKVYVWDAITGDQLNTFEDSSNTSSGLTALTVRGTSIATATSDGLIHFRDFSNCTVCMDQDSVGTFRDRSSRFWETSFDPC